jgi:starvation-inducible DNA-binding protein
MELLVEALKKAQATSFAFYLKAHNYHWNVEGSNFSEYHAFLGDLYAEVWGAVDAIAEHCRTLDAYVPGSFSRFQQLSSIDDELSVPAARPMMSKLLLDNQRVIADLTVAYRAAETAGKVGIANFLQDRIDIHEKHGWMLRSFIKGE